MAGQIGTLGGAVVGGIWGYEEANTSAMPEFFANEAQKALEAKAEAEKTKELLKAYESKLDSHEHASHYFSDKGKLEYYRQYHSDIGVEQSAIEAAD